MQLTLLKSRLIDRNKIPMKDTYLNQYNKLFIVTNGYKTAGYKDVMSTLDPKVKNTATTRTIDARDDHAIIVTLQSEVIREGDVVCIARGGGDILDPSFRAYHNIDSAQYLRKLKSEGVIIVTGIGHASDKFILDDYATYHCITPTAAAQKINDIYKGKESNDVLIKINEEMTFDSFYFSEQNENTINICKSLVKEYDDNYSPLFIHGNSGVGKTHLLNAIANEFKSINENSQLTILNTNDYLDLLYESYANQTHNNLNSFVKSSKVVIFDDIGYFVLRKATTYLKKIFNYCTENKICLIVSDNRDKIPESKAFKDVVDSCIYLELIGPCEKIKFDIISQEIKHHGINISDSNINLIAKKTNKNIKNLKAAIKTLAIKSLNGTNVDDKVIINSVLKKWLTTKAIKIDQIIDQICEFYDIDKSELTAKKRSKSIARPRMIAMYLCKELTKNSFPEIAKNFYRDHTTVIYAVKNISKLINEEPQVKIDIDLIKKNLSN